MYLSIEIGVSHIVFSKIKEDKILSVIHEEYLPLWLKTKEDKDYLEKYIYNNLIYVILNEFLEIAENDFNFENLLEEKKIINKICFSIPGIIREEENLIIQNTGNIEVNNLNFVNEIKENLIYAISNLEIDYGHNEIEIITEYINRLEFSIKNDTKSAFDCEKVYGIIKENDLRDCIFLTIGTGIGTIIQKNNELVIDGFELGHKVLEFNNYGITSFMEFEEAASLKNIKQILKELNINSSIKEILEFKTEEEKELYHNILEKMFDEQILNLQVGIRYLVNKFNIHNIVIAGGYSELENTILKDKIIKSLSNIKNMNNIDKTVNIYFAKYKNNAGIIGSGI